jgi:hypothetical protein
MELKNYIVVFYPFISSDVTSTQRMTGLSEADVRAQFRRENQIAQIKSVTEE